MEEERAQAELDGIVLRMLASETFEPAELVEVLVQRGHAEEDVRASIDRVRGQMLAEDAAAPRKAVLRRRATAARLISPSDRGYTLFDTALGACGVAWGPRGITALQLPEPTPAETVGRLLRRAGDLPGSAPPAGIQRAIDAVVALLAGARVDLADVPLDLDGVSPFHRRVYEHARAIPPGETRSYGEIARAVGSPGAARAVGQAMGKNPFPIVVPCHRVLAAGGKVGGFSAAGGVDTKKRMLAIERPIAG